MKQIMVQHLVIDIIRKKIKNIYLRVCNSTGRIKVSAPIRATEHTLREFLSTKVAWIESCLTAREPTLFYVTGETHYFNGNAYTLNVIDHPGRSKVILRAPYIDLYISPDKSALERQRRLERWYRDHLFATAMRLVATWQVIMQTNVVELNIKRMKTKWGTCNIAKRRIWLSLELAKKPLSCIEYVVVHEMVHLFERNHNKRFYALMDKYLTGWREKRKALNTGVHDCM